MKIFKRSQRYNKNFNLSTCTKGHFHLAQFSDPNKFEPGGNVLGHPDNKHQFLIWLS